MKDTPTLHNLNPQGRFTSRAEDYAKNRPSYPSAVIERILAELGDRSIIAADIGAGTGISSRLLADRGVKVIAIEPNSAMREVAKAHPLVEFDDSHAENIQLPDASVDLVTCFQAFHWFDPEPTLKEFSRILNPQGKMALVWNDRDVDGEDDFTREHNRIITTASNDSPIHNRLDGKSDVQISSFFSKKVEHYIFPYQQAFNLQGLIGLAMSASYLPQTGKAHQKLVTDLTNLYQKHQNSQDLVYLKYKTSLYLAEF
ncbi:MAG: class I SAM-dependent methyltransferase [Waterburya sp.]